MMLRPFPLRSDQSCLLGNGVVVQLYTTWIAHRPIDFLHLQLPTEIDSPLLWDVKRAQPRGTENLDSANFCAIK